MEQQAKLLGGFFSPLNSDFPSYHHTIQQSPSRALLSCHLPGVRNHVLHIHRGNNAFHLCRGPLLHSSLRRDLIMGDMFMRSPPLSLPPPTLPSLMVLTLLAQLLSWPKLIL